MNRHRHPTRARPKHRMNARDAPDRARPRGRRLGFGVVPDGRARVVVRATRHARTRCVRRSRARSIGERIARANAVRTSRVELVETGFAAGDSPARLRALQEKLVARRTRARVGKYQNEWSVCVVRVRMNSAWTLRVRRTRGEATKARAR